MGILANPGKHGRIHIDKYHRQGKPAPVCVSVGHDPTVFVEASYNVGLDSRAYAFGGWLRGRPMDVVRSPIYGLPISATAEIVHRRLRAHSPTRCRSSRGAVRRVARLLRLQRGAGRPR